MLSRYSPLPAQNGFNFKSTADKRLIGSLKAQAQMVQNVSKQKNSHDGMSGGIQVVIHAQDNIMIPSYRHA